MIHFPVGKLLVYWRRCFFNVPMINSSRHPAESAGIRPKLSIHLTTLSSRSSSKMGALADWIKPRNPNHEGMVFFWGICYSSFFSRMRSKGSRFTLGVWGLRVCSLDVAFASATVRNRPQPFAWGPYGRAYGKFYRGGPFWRFQTSGCFVSRGRRGTSWHSDVFCNVSKVVLRGRRNTFATFSEDVLQFSWQAQHFGRVHRHFSWQAQHFRRVLWRVFCKSHWQGCVKWWQGANSVAGRGILCDVLKIDGSLARNIDFEVANFQILRKTRRKTSILKLQSVKSGGSLARNARFGAPTCLFSRVWFSRGLAVSMGEAAKLVFLSCRQLWKLPEVSHKMLVFLYPRVLSCGACVSVASPCPWGKLENLSFLNVSKQVVMLFCVADVALFDIPTCLIMCRKCHNWRKSRTKRSFFCIHVSCLCVSFSLWRRCVYGGSGKTPPFRMFPCRLSCRFAWQAWHFVTFQPVW